MIPVPVATVVLMVVTITYKSVLVVIGCLLAVFGQGFLNRYLYEVLPVYYLGLALNVVFCAAMLVLADYPGASPVNDFCVRRYAASSGGHGNQRASVPDHIRSYFLRGSAFARHGIVQRYCVLCTAGIQRSGDHVRPYYIGEKA